MRILVHNPKIWITSSFIINLLSLNYVKRLCVDISWFFVSLIFSPSFLFLHFCFTTCYQFPSALYRPQYMPGLCKAGANLEKVKADIDLRSWRAHGVNEYNSLSSSWYCSAGFADSPRLPPTVSFGRWMMWYVIYKHQTVSDGEKFTDYTQKVIWHCKGSSVRSERQHTKSLLSNKSSMGSYYNRRKWIKRMKIIGLKKYTCKTKSVS